MEDCPDAHETCDWSEKGSDEPGVCILYTTTRLFTTTPGAPLLTTEAGEPLLTTEAGEPLLRTDAGEPLWHMSSTPLLAFPFNITDNPVAIDIGASAGTPKKASWQPIRETQEKFKKT
jgi:hypothetical protein